jgi:hypothetical protein
MSMKREVIGSVICFSIGTGPGDTIVQLICSHTQHTLLHAIEGSG